MFDRRSFLNSFGMTAAAVVAGLFGVVARTQQPDYLKHQKLSYLAKLQFMYPPGCHIPHGLKSVGLDWREECKRMLEEQRFQAEQQAKLQKALEYAI